MLQHREGEDFDKSWETSHLEYCIVETHVVVAISTARTIP